jgi:hypothetical protein
MEGGGIRRFALCQLFQILGCLAVITQAERGTASQEQRGGILTEHRLNRLQSLPIPRLLIEFFRFPQFDRYSPEKRPKRGP